MELLFESNLRKIMTLEKRKLGNSDLEITRIGFGAWAIGGSWQWGWGKQDDQQSIRTVHAALDQGINWIDTAAAYGLGRSEEVLGKALKKTSNRPLIFTKCGLVWDKESGERSVRNELSAGSVQAEIEGSLKRLEIETIDLYQIHWPIPDQRIEEAFEVMAKAQSAGKIRHLGVSNFSIEQMERVGKIAEITSLQPPYSLVFPEVEEKTLPYCLEKNIGVINYSPMASGLLSGKMSKERIDNMDQDDWRRRADHFTGSRLERNLALAELLKAIGSRHQATAGEVAIAWTLVNPAVTGAIVGMRNPDQVGGVIGAGELQLSEQDLSEISDFIAKNP